MVSMRITELDLGEGVVHMSTDWQISTSKLFELENIVCESKEDAINKTHIEFNEILDPKIKYYGRARELLSTGYTMWGNIDTFIPTDINDVEIDTDLPTTVGPPILVTDSSFNNHALSLFTLSATGFSVIGTADHLSTSWIIEDIEGDIVWSSLKNIFNKSSIHVNSIILKNDTVYRIRAVFHATSEDSSQVATKTIVTADNADNVLTTKVTDIDIDSELTLGILSVIGVNETDWEIYSLEDSNSSVVWSKKETTGDVNTTVVPNGVFKDNAEYLLKVKSNINPNWGFYDFNTY